MLKHPLNIGPEESAVTDFFASQAAAIEIHRRRIRELMQRKATWKKRDASLKKSAAK